MMNENQLEHYYFYKLYSVDFDSVKNCFKILKRYRRKDVRFSLIRDIVVSYARPFSGNQGELLSKHRLRKKVVPKEYHPLHKELIDARNQLFAHTDYTYRKPKVANWSTETRRWFPMSFRGYDYSRLDSRISEIESLVESVDEALQRQIYELEKDF
jgi:hypothetical protein